jgi:xanthine dehydrogenase accessory factor
MTSGPRVHAQVPGDGCPLRFHEALLQQLSQGRRVAVATVTRGRGSTPREAGAKMIVDEDGTTRFSVGGGALEASVTADCRAALEADESGRVRRYDLTEDGENSVGMTCGGSVEVFIEVLCPPHRLVVFGAGHVGRALCAAASVAGFALTVVDDRADWLDAGAFPLGVSLHRCGRDYTADLPSISPADLVAVMTRCHATDLCVLEHLAAKPPRYTGMIGSKRKVLRAKELLAEKGVDAAWLSALRAPIGLDLGAETPGEIGVAVAAELISHLRKSGS